MPAPKYGEHHVVSAWIDPELARGLQQLAARNDRSKSGQIRHLVREAVAQDQRSALKTSPA